jgi:prepilin-type N-terminal cleavage/methylation domain-containing protein
MTMAKMRGFRKGLTLIEVMVSLLIFLVVLMALYQLFDTSHSTYSSGTRRQDVQQQARLAMEEIVRSLRMAGYVSENYDALTANDVTGTARIHVATPTALAVFGNLDGSVYNAGPPPVPASAAFLFCQNGTSVLVKRGTDTADPVTYRCTEDNVVPTLATNVIADNVSLLRFTYFDVNGAQLTGNLDGKAVAAALDLAPRTQRDAVRTIVVTLQTTETAPHQKTQVYTLTSTVRLRNLNNL